MRLEGERVLVTGAGGFIGSHLVQALVAEGATVRALVDYESRGSGGWLATLPVAERRAVEMVAGDVRDPNGVRAAVAGCRAVFHLAALIGIPFSYEAADTYVATNVQGTLNVLQAARAQGVERVLVTSTSEVYGTAQRVPIDEHHPLVAQSPYSATKIAADKLAESFHRSFGLPVVIVRPFNTYGPRQSARAVIPTIIVQLLAGRKEIRLGRLDPRRDFVFVRDTARAFVALAGCDAAIGEEVNVATGADVSIGELAQRLIEEIDPSARIVTEEVRVRPGPSEVRRLLGSTEKLRALTGWAPEVTLARGLAETVAWFREPAQLAQYAADTYAV